uniref:Uncharacterized protein n=1 Tax=Astyanax mexicanus TaxID=7994 RepID=A0A8B9LND0_ASTMX
ARYVIVILKENFKTFVYEMNHKRTWAMQQDNDTKCKIHSVCPLVNMVSVTEDQSGTLSLYHSHSLTFTTLSTLFCHAHFFSRVRFLCICVRIFS